MSEIQNKIDKGFKRLALVCSVWTLIVSLPIIIWTDELNKLSDWYRILSIVIWLGIINLGIVLSPKIVSKIWK